MGGAPHHIEHAAVRDHQHRLACVLLRNALHGVHHAGVELAGGFATGHAVVGFKAHPALPGLGVIGFHVLHTQPVHNAKVLLAQPGVCHGVQRQVGQQRLRRRLGRLPRAQQVAAHQVLHTEPLSQQPLRHAAGLLQARGVQRHIHLALKAQLAVPVGFAVADEDEFGHGGMVLCAYYKKKTALAQLEKAPEAMLFIAKETISVAMWPDARPAPGTPPPPPG